MTKKFISLLSFCLILPNCAKKDLLIPNENVSLNSSLAPVEYKPQENNLQGNEELDSFILEENAQNPFDHTNPNKLKNITLEDSDNPEIANNRYENSEQYGLQPIYYDFNKKSIKLDQKEKLTKDLEILRNLVEKKYNIVIEGHACDSAGSPHYNLILSEDRAQVVADYLISQGINKSQIMVVGRGCEMRIVPFGNKEQQAPNRRVEIFAYRHSEL